MIAVVDSGGANIASVLHAFARIGVPAKLTAEASEIARAKLVVLPGVGAAAHAMRTLRERELDYCLRELKQPVLGICLGMQLLFDASSEGNVRCLGMIPGRVAQLESREDLPVPHMGWNRVRRQSGTSTRLLEGVDDGEYFYFVHSFVAPLGEAVKGVAEYGNLIPAIVEQDNYFGVQFHPERSSAAGERLLRNFVGLNS